MKKVSGFSKRVSVRSENPDVGVFRNQKVIWWGTWYDKRAWLMIYCRLQQYLHLWPYPSRHQQYAFWMSIIYLIMAPPRPSPAHRHHHDGRPIIGWAHVAHHEMPKYHNDYRHLLIQKKILPTIIMTPLFTPKRAFFWQLLLAYHVSYTIGIEITLEFSWLLWIFTFLSHFDSLPPTARRSQPFQACWWRAKGDAWLSSRPKKSLWIIRLWYVSI